jgi:hypothetical protein
MEEMSRFSQESGQGILRPDRYLAFLGYCQSPIASCRFKFGSVAI